MKLIDIFLQRYKNTRISINISIKTATKVAENNSYSLILQDIIKTDNIPTAIQLTNGENMAAESTMTMKLPQDALITEAPQGLVISYETAERKISITLTGTPIANTKTEQPHPVHQKDAANDLPKIREVKDSHDQISKITIQTPATYQDQSFFEQLKQLIESFLRDWRTLSLAKKRTGTATWLHKNVRFDQIATVFIPGDTFFQISAFEGKELITIDIPTSMTISVQNKNILFDFDDISYELVQGDKPTMR